MSPRQATPLRIPSDTDAESYASQIEAYRRMEGKERTAVVFRLNQLARRAAEAGIRSRHPDYSGEQVHRALFRLMLGDEITTAAWPDETLVDP